MSRTSSRYKHRLKSRLRRSLPAIMLLYLFSPFAALASPVQCICDDCLALESGFSGACDCSDPCCTGNCGCSADTDQPVLIPDCSGDCSDLSFVICKPPGLEIPPPQLSHGFLQIPAQLLPERDLLAIGCKFQQSGINFTGISSANLTIQLLM